MTKNVEVQQLISALPIMPQQGSVIGVAEGSLFLICPVWVIWCLVFKFGVSRYRESGLRG